MAKKYFNSFSEGDYLDLNRLIRICETKKDRADILNEGDIQESEL